MVRSNSCPICGGESRRLRTVPDWGEMRQCPSCELGFAHPMNLPESPESFYNKAYQGALETPGMGQYAERIRAREHLNKANIAPERIIYIGSRSEAMAWLKQNIHRGSMVLDIGCAMGDFLRALRKNGFNPVGMDVAKEVADMLSGEGFDIWHGTVDSIPDNWQNPAICTCFFVLQHVPDPVGFLGSIRQKFPSAGLIIATWKRFPSPPKITPASLPPRTMTWWGPRSLEKALNQAGYHVDLISQPLEPYEFGLPRIRQQGFSEWALSSGHYGLFSVWHAVKPRVFWPWRLWKRLRGRSSSILALARPDGLSPPEI